ncbi:MAG: tetratricopeptide repeat protein [Saprospiraceae bacterium]|nr:tetratricopeptide repeat protein [Saprospiraceae bacterium]
MERLLKYCLSLCLASFLFMSCDNIIKETFHKMTVEEKKQLSKDYVRLANLTERGSSKAMRILEKAVRLDPQNDQAWRELSLPYLHAGLYSEWSENMRMAIEINPENWQGWRAYDRLFYVRDYAGALFDLDATDTLTKNQVDYLQNTSVDYLRGLCYLGLKDYNKSIEYFNIYIEDDKKKVGDKFVDETAFLYLGIVYLKEDKYQEAIQNLQRGILYEEGNADFHFHLARAYCFLGDLDEARKQLTIAKKKFEDRNAMRGFRYEAIEQIYLSDILELEADLNIGT